jgi:hypothetical protein
VDAAVKKGTAQSLAHAHIVAITRLLVNRQLKYPASYQYICGR